MAAGLAPGPLLTLVISETLKGNYRNGILIALSPLVTDLPIIAFSALVLHILPDKDIFYGVISLAGGIFLVYLAFQNFKLKQGLELQNDERNSSLKIGVVTNVLSPHPYLFWVSIGMPTVYKAYDISLNTALLFIGGFYMMLVGSKIAVALISDRSKGFIQSKWYVWIVRLLGLLLFVFAVLLFLDGLSFIT